MWDVEIDSILKEIPLGGSSTETTTSPKPLEPVQPKTIEPKTVEPKKEDPQKYQREVRTQIAEAKAKIRKGDLSSAITSLSSLRKIMNDKGLYDFDKSIDEVLNTVNIPAKSGSTEKKVATPSTAKKVSEAERLLASGKFPEAKRAFASEGNSAMAQICSELIKSKRTITLYQSGLESARRSTNMTTAATAIRELSSILKIYKTHNIDSATLEGLINNYKSIK